MLSVLISVWCTFDTAGRSWVKMQQFQQSVRDRERDREKEKQDGIKRRKSGSRRRNWRHRCLLFKLLFYFPKLFIVYCILTLNVVNLINISLIISNFAKLHGNKIK